LGKRLIIIEYNVIYVTIGIDFIYGSLSIRTQNIPAVLNRAVDVVKRGGRDVS
jgi:hypothetical protein